MAIISAQNVSFIYRNKFQTVEAVKSVNVNFDCGILYAIIGKSGSGKSTLLSMFAGLENPTNGDVLYNGESLRTYDLSDYRLNKASLIFQSFNLFPLLTVYENVLLPLRIKKIPKEKAAASASEALIAVGLGKEYHKRFPRMLSGGEQQRVAIARTLASGSDIILADEPTGNLDGENSAVVIDILKMLAHKHNRCVIVVTHDNAVSEQANTVFEMRDGMINT